MGWETSKEEEKLILKMFLKKTGILLFKKKELLFKKKNRGIIYQLRSGYLFQFKSMSKIMQQGKHEV